MNLEELQHLISSGERVKFLYFWGHRPQRDGSIGPGCLSQWWPSAFTVDGATYPTAEHYMMAGKARLFGDLAAVDHILAAQARWIGCGASDSRPTTRERRTPPGGGVSTCSGSR